MSSTKGSAIVTGSARGIGKGIALRLALDGYDVALFDIPQNKESLEEVASTIVKDTGRKSIVVTGDVTIEKDIVGLVEQTVQAFGGLDVMVANAGIHCLAEITELSEEKLDRTLAVNVKGTMFCYKHAASQMIKQGRGGRIVGAASTASKQGMAGGAGYCASKFAVRGLTQSAALELGKHGITVNAYAPGPIDTPFLAGFDKYYSEKDISLKGVSFNDNLKNSAPMGRLGTPEDVAALVSFLVKEEASFITGQSVVLSGGLYHFD